MRMMGSWMWLVGGSRVESSHTGPRSGAVTGGPSWKMLDYSKCNIWEILREYLHCRWYWLQVLIFSGTRPCKTLT
ncbi:hypothetical protein LIA77_08661 [Sarocladium implicatum]|nr:hypothetical protein LIA77_08661 [Sarocladium implicatum]